MWYVLFFLICFGTFANVLVAFGTYQSALVKERIRYCAVWRYFRTVERPRTKSMNWTTHGIVLASGTHVAGRTSFSLTTRHSVVIRFVGNSCTAWIVSKTTRSLSIDGCETEEARGTNTELWVQGLAHTSLGQMAPKVAFIKLVIGIRGSSPIGMYTIQKTNGD